ncbi:MAG: trypsin-like peptidase domain-containing protein [Proteobacteria bacterium]|nr:trypsin-like peptidase domain-containing protein [Pseudomonadota bacterium]
MRFFYLIQVMTGLFLFSSQVLALELGALRKAVFKVRVISQEPDFKQVWNKQPLQTSSGTGFYIGKEGILTNAHVVGQGKFISVLKDGDDQPMSARVKFIAHDCDLALLEVQDPHYFQGITPLGFGATPDVRETVNTVGFPTGGEQLSVTQGVVSRISYRRYVHSMTDSHLLVQVDSAINPGNSGGPVIQGKSVVGVAFQSMSGAENTGYIIPTAVVKRFLDDIADGSYDGHPVQGFTLQEGALENAATRRFHGLKNGEGGIKVSEVASFSPLNGKIFPGDILLSIEAKPIGVDGKIRFQGERMNLRVVYDLKQRNDSIGFQILRDGKRLHVDIKLEAQEPYYDPAHRFSGHPRFLIFAGLVFSALGRDYLENWGKNWSSEAPLILRYVHSFAAQISEFRAHRDIIVLSERLPDSINTFAGAFMDSILLRLNGQAVNSLDELSVQLDKAQQEHLVFEFYRGKVPLVLALKPAREVDQNIIARYKLPLARYLGSEKEDGATANWEAGP